MGCGSSVDKQSQPIEKKDNNEPKPLQLDDKNQDGSIQDPDENKKLINKKHENGDNLDGKEAQFDIQSQTTPLHTQATIKKILIIPPFDSEGNLQDEIKTLEIKDDVQTNLKKQRLNEAKRKKTIQEEGSNNEIESNKASDEKIKQNCEGYQENKDDSNHNKESQAKSTANNSSSSQQNNYDRQQSIQRNEKTGEKQQSQKIQNRQQDYEENSQQAKQQEQKDFKQNDQEIKGQKQNKSQINQKDSGIKQQNGQSNQNKNGQEQSNQNEDELLQVYNHPPQKDPEQTQQTNGQNTNLQPIQQFSYYEVKPPEKAQPIKDIKEYVIQQDLLKNLKQKNHSPQQDQFSEYVERFQYQGGDYFSEEQFDISQIISKQESLVDSQILMQIEDDQIIRKKPIQLDYQQNLLKEIKKQNTNLQPLQVEHQQTNQKNHDYQQQEKDYQYHHNNNVDLLKMIKMQQNNNTNQNMPQQESVNKQKEVESQPQTQQVNQKQPQKQNQREEKKNNDQIQTSQKTSNESNKKTNGISDSQKSQTEPQKNLLSIKTEESQKMPSQQKRLQKENSQTMSLTNGIDKNEASQNDQLQKKNGQAYELNRMNTFDTINDTISNASPINTSSMQNTESKQQIKKDKFIFNNITESNPLKRIKKQETNMTEELELIMKGMDEKPVIPSIYSQNRLEYQKTDEFSNKRSASVFNDLNLHKMQSELLQNSADKNSSNLICDFERNDSRDEFQISISSPIKNLQNSRVLHTNSIQKDVNEDGKKQINQYTLVKELGRGNCGKVKLGLDEVTQKYYAIKVSNKNKLKSKLISQKVSAFTLLEQEIAIMKKVDHPHIVKLHEVIEDSEDNKLYLVMEFMKRGSILSQTYFKATLKSQDPDKYNIYYDSNGQLKNKSNEPKSIDITQALRYMRQMALALDYMHTFAQIVHRDIKPDNLLIDEQDNLKVADFGISQLMEESDETSSNAGTKAFMSPETWEKKIFKATPLDIWATGVTFYFMIYGNIPFKEKKMMDLKNEICSKEIKLPDTPVLPEQAKDLLFKMLEKNPDKRINAKEMLVHPWLTNNGQIILRNVIDHSLQVGKSDLEKAIGKSTKISASVMIALGLKRVLKRARQSIQLNELTQNSLNSSTPGSGKNNRRSFLNADKNKMDNFSKFSQRAIQEKQEKEQEFQKLNVSQILKDEDFNN